MKAWYMVPCILTGKNAEGMINAFTNFNNVICKLCILSIGDRYTCCSGNRSCDLEDYKDLQERIEQLKEELEDEDDDGDIVVRV